MSRTTRYHQRNLSAAMFHRGDGYPLLGISGCSLLVSDSGSGLIASWTRDQLVLATAHTDVFLMAAPIQEDWRLNGQK